MFPLALSINLCHLYPFFLVAFLFCYHSDCMFPLSLFNISILSLFYSQPYLLHVSYHDNVSFLTHLFTACSSPSLYLSSRYFPLLFLPLDRSRLVSLVSFYSLAPFSLSLFFSLALLPLITVQHASLTLISCFKKGNEKKCVLRERCESGCHGKIRQQSVIRIDITIRESFFTIHNYCYLYMIPVDSGLVEISQSKNGFQVH